MSEFFVWISSHHMPVRVCLLSEHAYKKTARVAWLLWSVYPCCSEVQLHKAVCSWTLPLPSLPLVKQHPINRPLAIFRLAKLWFTCQRLHWWCLCTGPQYTSTAVLMVSGLLSLPHQQKQMGKCNVSQKSQGYEERGKFKFIRPYIQPGMEQNGTWEGKSKWLRIRTNRTG